MKTIRWILSMAFAFSMVVLPVKAEEMDLSQPCSLVVTIHDTTVDAGVPGVDISIYKVAKAVFDPYTGYSYELADAFVSSGVNLIDLTSTNASDVDEARADLETYIASAAVSPLSTGTTDENGKVSFSGLEVGLYLTVQTSVIENTAGIDSFMISLPQEDGNGGWTYVVDAAPKMGTVSSIPVPPEQPVTPPTLPQTGQLKWPIPVLTIGGISLIAVGLYLTREKKHA